MASRQDEGWWGIKKNKRELKRWPTVEEGMRVGVEKGRIYTCSCAHIHTCMYSCLYPCTNTTCIYIHLHPCTHVYISMILMYILYSCIYTCTRVYIRICACITIHTLKTCALYTYMQVHTRMSIYTYMCLHTCM